MHFSSIKPPNAPFGTVAVLLTPCTKLVYGIFAGNKNTKQIYVDILYGIVPLFLFDFF